MAHLPFFYFWDAYCEGTVEQKRELQEWRDAMMKLPYFNSYGVQKFVEVLCYVCIADKPQAEVWRDRLAALRGLYDRMLACGDNARRLKKEIKPFLQNTLPEKSDGEFEKNKLIDALDEHTDEFKWSTEKSWF